MCIVVAAAVTENVFSIFLSFRSRPPCVTGSVSMVVELGICIISMRGSILDTSPRKSMHYWLYTKLGKRFILEISPESSLCVPRDVSALGDSAEPGMHAFLPAARITSARRCETIASRSETEGKKHATETSGRKRSDSEREKQVLSGLAANSERCKCDQRRAQISRETVIFVIDFYDEVNCRLKRRMMQTGRKTVCPSGFSFVFLPNHLSHGALSKLNYRIYGTFN